MLSLCMYYIPPMICWKMVQASSSGILNRVVNTWINQGLLFAFDDIVKKFSAFHILHDQKELFRGFDDLIQLDDVGMSDQLQDVYLSGNALNVSYVDYFFFF